VRFRFLTFVAACVLAASGTAVEPLSLSIDNAAAAKTLRGRDARLQLVVSATDTSTGQITDVTHEVQFQVEPTAVATVDDSLVRPQADGEATITARHPNGLTTTTTIQVVETGNESEISFPGRIVPIFTKLSCNSGGCHGKAAGQNGFKLSLLGFEPREDFEHLVRESRGRRVSPAAPDRSLLLLKAINESAHGGGQRLEKDSHEYRMLRRWIEQGMPYGTDNEPKVVSIEVLPKQRRLAAQAAQQLSVVAHFSDGSAEDVTRAAVYESNDPEMAEVTPTGRVSLRDLAGDVAVMARYQGQVTVFRADIPLGTNVASDWFPAPRNVIDTFVFKKLASLGIPPSPACDDATFLRRVTLDIAGRLPTLAEVEQFASDTREDKRDVLVDRLLSSADYADYFAGKWNAILRNRRTGGELKFANMAFHQWIRDNIAANTPYDQFVSEIVTASGTVASHPPVAWYQQVTDTNQRMEDAAQLFLGQRIQCARCHHHPYEKWSQANYAQMEAFFTTVATKPNGDPGEPITFARFGGAAARHPKTGETLMPAALDDESQPISADTDPRTQLAQWMTDPSNPFFAKSLVNRYWKHFLGRGLVEPEDDLRITNPPSNPELMDAVAASFVESGYDMQALIRLIVQSKTYQFQSDATEQNLADRRSYSRFYPKRMRAEVLLDAIDAITDAPTRFAGMPANVRAVALPDNGFDSYFLEVFGRPAATTACECERSQEPSLAQNLHLLNSKEMQAKLSVETGRAAKLAADASQPDEAKIRDLYRLAFSREPNDEELKMTLAYLAEKPNRREAFEDVVWSLVNSKEFLFNH
jgi:Protein of unknown function (DUF1553)/Protein of unknown function (DUF1549)